jgi:hypothetical protein
MRPVLWRAIALIHLGRDLAFATGSSPVRPFCCRNTTAAGGFRWRRYHELARELEMSSIRRRSRGKALASLSTMRLAGVRGGQVRSAPFCCRNTTAAGGFRWRRYHELARELEHVFKYFRGRAVSGGSSRDGGKNGNYGSDVRVLFDVPACERHCGVLAGWEGGMRPAAVGCSWRR